MNAQENPKIGISACLLGHRVRYNGDGKPDQWILKVLAPFVDFAPFCPEMAMGLGAPRETLRLITDHRLIGNQSGLDFTSDAQTAAQKIIASLPDLDGVILKRASPTCGLEKVKVYGKNGIPQTTGQGIFATAIREAFPSTPMIEEGRLTDPFQREQFLTRVFSLFYYKQKMRSASIGRPSAITGELQNFHKKYKFLLLSHNPTSYTRLGRIAANSERLAPEQTIEQYYLELAKALATPPTPGKRMNALQHLFGFFKEVLSAKEKEHFLKLLEEYRAGIKPFTVALALLEHLSQRFNDNYILGQMIFYPFPVHLNRPLEAFTSLAKEGLR